MKKKSVGFASMALVFVFLAIYSAMPSANTPYDNSGDRLQYHATVTTSTTGDFNGRITPAHQGIMEIVGSSHNTLYNNGQNMTRQALGVGGTAAILNISLCNGTAVCNTPVNDGTETFTLYTDSGLASAVGTYSSSKTAGNWSVYKTFTATVDNLKVNATRLVNDSGSLFAGNTFTLVTLQTNDQLTINWTISIS